MITISLSEIRAANIAAGRYFFSPDTMRFFRSRVESRLARVGADGSAYFVTSEQFGEGAPRRFSVRAYDPTTADVRTVGEVQGYGSRKAALAAILEIVSPRVEMGR